MSLKGALYRSLPYARGQLHLPALENIMILSTLICTGIAVFCFMNGMVLAGLLSLAGLIPGPGTIPLLLSAVMLAVNGYYLAAFFSVFVILFNYFWVVYSLKG